MSLLGNQQRAVLGENGGEAIVNLRIRLCVWGTSDLSGGSALKTSICVTGGGRG